MTTPATEPKKYFVRFSRDEDYAKLMDFYKDNAHQNVLPRDESVMRDLVDNGAAIILEDEKGVIVAASISYSLIEDKNGLSCKWVEIGTTRCVLSGYGKIFDALVPLQALRAFVVEPPEEGFICHVITEPVQKIISRFGFKPFAIQQDILDAKRKLLSQASAKADQSDNWFALDTEDFPRAIKAMWEVLDSPHLENYKTGERIKIDISRSKFLTSFNEEIRALAKDDFNKVSNDNRKKSYAQKRRAWGNRFFK